MFFGRFYVFFLLLYFLFLLFEVLLNIFLVLFVLLLFGLRFLSFFVFYLLPFGFQFILCLFKLLFFLFKQLFLPFFSLLALQPHILSCFLIKFYFLFMVFSSLMFESFCPSSFLLIMIMLLNPKLQCFRPFSSHQLILNSCFALVSNFVFSIFNCVQSIIQPICHLLSH